MNNNYELRITEAVALIEKRVGILLQEKYRLETAIKNLTQENTKLKTITESVISRIDGYLTELEDIRRNHGNSNNSN